MSAAELLLSWRLDGLDDGVARDWAGGGYDGTAAGDPGVRADDRFGSCVVLDGRDDAIEGPDPLPAPGTYTVSAWIRAHSRTGLWVNVALARLYRFQILVHSSGAIEHEIPGGREYFTAPGTLTFDQWHHLAVTDDGSTARILLDGVVVAEQAGGWSVANPPGRLQVGRSYRSDSHLAMDVACVRLYDAALTPAQVQWDMVSDESATSAFVRTHPLAFELLNPAEQPVLYLDDAGSAQSMVLRVTNSSRRDVVLWPAGTVATADASHLTLTWRAGTLAAASDPRLAVDGWSLATTPDRTGFHLLASSGTTIAAGGAIELPLTGLRPDPTDGTRATRVQAAFQRMGYPDEAAEITGTRQLAVEVVNHRGRPDIPLHIGFVDGDRVLSGARDPESLRLRVANVSRDLDITLTGSAGANPAPSAFTLSFDAQLDNETREWALVTAATVGSVGVSLTGTSVQWDVTHDPLAERPSWTFTPAEDTTLQGGSAVEFVIDGILALPSPGSAPVVLAYENIPGFQDGQAVASAERTALLFAGDRVGVGTAAPEARLHVVGAESDPNGRTLVIGPISRPNLRLGHNSGYSWIQSHGSAPLSINAYGNNIGVGTVTPDARLHILTGATDANGKTLVIGPTNQPNLRLGYAPTYSWIQSHGPAPLAINELGNNVGIGTSAPGFRLTVRSVTEHLQLRREEQTGGSQIYLELYQSETPAGVVTYPNLRFHHASKFWHRIEGRPEGIAIKWGPPTSEAYSDLFARTANLAGLTIGGITIGERELKILKYLADGRLEVDLFNVRTEEYAFADPNRTQDGDRRFVYTWRRQTTTDSSRWRLRAPDQMLGS